MKRDPAQCGVIKLTAESFEKSCIILCIHNYKNITERENREKLLISLILKTLVMLERVVLRVWVKKVL